MYFYTGVTYSSASLSTGSLAYFITFIMSLINITGTATQPRNTDIKSLIKIPFPLTAVIICDAHLQPEGIPAMQYAKKIPIPPDIADPIKSSFVKIAKSMANAIPKITTSLTKFLIAFFSHCFFSSIRRIFSHYITIVVISQYIKTMIDYNFAINYLKYNKSTMWR